MIVSFCRTGYDPFIDYLKGVCILWVVITHAITPIIHDYSLFCLWGDMGVPLFLLIQCIHVFKRGDNHYSINWGKIWKRVVKPFLILQILFFLIGVSKYILLHRDPTVFINNFIILGGTGRGCFYPKMYIEFAILILLFYPIFRRSSKMGGVYCC